MTPEEWVESQLAEAPPLNDEQLDRLRTILRSPYAQPVTMHEGETPPGDGYLETAEGVRRVS